MSLNTTKELKYGKQQHAPKMLKVQATASCPEIM
jgi:hypothetical protein